MVMKTIATKGYDQTINAYIDSLYDYMFNIGGLSTFSLYNNILVSKPTILNSYLPYFKPYAIKKVVDKKYYQRPNLFALDYYGASELEWLVLYISGISDPVDFNFPIIDVLPVNILNDINKLVILSKDEVEESKRNPSKFTSDSIKIEKQIGFIEERYKFKSNTNMNDLLINERIRKLSKHGVGANENAIPQSINRMIESIKYLKK